MTDCGSAAGTQRLKDCLRDLEIGKSTTTSKNKINNMLEICPRGNNKYSYYYIFVFMINVCIHAITVLKGNINTCVICKLKLKSLVKPLYNTSLLVNK